MTNSNMTTDFKIYALNQIYDLIIICLPIILDIKILKRLPQNGKFLKGLLYDSLKSSVADFQIEIMSKDLIAKLDSETLELNVLMS